MKITIDKSGRIVVPKSIRERYHMTPGTTLELENKPEGIELKVSEKSPALIRKEGILVHHGTETSDVDITDFVGRERERRNADLSEIQQDR